jgi:hypothetical protein
MLDREIARHARLDDAALRVVQAAKAWEAVYFENVPGGLK